MVSPATRVQDALALLDERRITSLLVLDHQHIVGVFKK
jgi:arabinose-5-phosphate isomerase